MYKCVCWEWIQLLFHILKWGAGLCKWEYDDQTILKFIKNVFLFFWYITLKKIRKGIHDIGLFCFLLKNLMSFSHTSAIKNDDISLKLVGASLFYTCAFLCYNRLLNLLACNKHSSLLCQCKNCWKAL